MSDEVRALHINSQALCGSLDVVLMRGGVVVALWGFAASTSEAERGRRVTHR